MRKRILGRSGIEVSEVSFGTVALGIPYGIGINGKSDMLSEPDAVNLLQAALDKGINFFDTAEDYGCSEERIGKAFKNRRSDAVICTKSMQLYDNNSMFPEDKLKTLIDESLNKSLSSLGTDYIDIFMVHNANLATLENHIVTDTFSECKKQGKARALGVSVYSVEETRAAIESGVWDVIQLPYNLMDQRQGKLFALAKQKGVGIVVRSVLFKGILTDRGINLHPELKKVEEHRNLYNQLLNDKIPTMSDLATKFVLSQKEVSSVLVGIDKLEYLDKALAVADGNYLDEKTLEIAGSLAYPNPEFLDLGKWVNKGWLT